MSAKQMLDKMCSCTRPVDSGRKYGSHLACSICGRFLSTADTRNRLKAQARVEYERDLRERLRRAKGGLDP